MAKNKFTDYYLVVNLDERGEYSASVYDPSEKSVFEIESAEQVKEMQDDGFLKNKPDEDLDRLTKYLMGNETIPSGSQIWSQEEFEEKVKEKYSLGGVLAGVALGIVGLVGYQNHQKNQGQVNHQVARDSSPANRDASSYEERVRVHQQKMKARQDELRKQGLPKEIRFRSDRENGSEKVISVYQKLVDGKWLDISKEEYDDLTTMETEWNSDISLYKAKHKMKNI